LHAEAILLANILIWDEGRVLVLLLGEMNEQATLQRESRTLMSKVVGLHTNHLPSRHSQLDAGLGERRTKRGEQDRN